MTTSRRDMLKRTAAITGAAWVAPSVISETAASAVTCTCYGFTGISSSGGCAAITGVNANLGPNCGDATTGAVKAMNDALGSCTSISSNCSAFPSGFNVTWNGTLSVSLVLPVGSTPLFLGVRYNNGCAYFAPGSNYGGNLTGTASNIVTNFSNCGGTAPFPTGTVMTWTVSSRTFTATTSNWADGSCSGGNRVNGISHLTILWRQCGS